MTYNWNTMVEITVPTGTNGWLYSGEVIINGVKVRFPVGVPTSVPEPAAVLLKKMIELEQEEDANTAKPQNHYVGDVTIPAGKTLTLEMGAKFVDNSAPSDVVILPETEVTVFGAENMITTAPNAMPEVGSICTVTYNGTAYDSPAVASPAEAGMSGIAFGNTDVLGIPGGNANAPFLVILLDTPIDVGGVTAYGALVPMEEFAEGTFVTLSIVQKAATESAGGGGGIVVTVNDSGTPSHTVEEIFNAYHSGRNVTAVLMGYMVFQLVMVLFGTDEDGAIFGLRQNGATMELIIKPDNTIEFNQYPDPGGEYLVYLNSETKASATRDEMKEALDQGLRVRMAKMYSPAYTMELASFDGNSAYFSHVSNDGTNITIASYAVDNTGAVTYCEKTITG